MVPGGPDRRFPAATPTYHCASIRTIRLAPQAKAWRPMPALCLKVP